MESVNNLVINLHIIMQVTRGLCASWKSVLESVGN